MSKGAIIGVVVLVMMCSSAAGAAFVLMGGEEDVKTGPGPAPPSSVTAPVPSYTLREESTPSNDWGGGNMVYLDRHTLDCGDDGINQFRLGRPTPSEIQYKYKCLEGINSPASENKDTGANDWGGGNTVYLDRHDVNCDKKPIAKFRLTRPQSNQIRYDYTCNSKQATGACRDADSGWNQESNQNVYLDRHDVKCNDDEVITQFKLGRDGAGKFRYTYKCCKM